MTTIWTVGYSGGGGPEGLMERLVEAGVQAVLDVRRNPFSKWHPQWSKPGLSAFIREGGLLYHHEPRVGLPPELRHQLTRAGYFTHAKASGGLEPLLKLVTRKRCALLCSEKDHSECHRDPLSELLSKALDGKVVHL